MRAVGRLPLIVCFAAFVTTFVVTRVITRMIRADTGPFKDNVSEGGLHIHHAVPGVVLLVVGAFMAVAATTTTWSVIAALLVGVGTSLVLDEFALILHLSDVYWSDEGRISVEMVSLAIGCLGLVLLGVQPFGGLDDPEDGGTFLSSLVSIALVLLAIVVCVAKGKYRFALFGAFIFVFAFVGAFRLARPDSRWARRRYGPEKLARAEVRMAKQEARYGPMATWVSDFVAGKPSSAA
jgi:hypothetical protein